ncbi:MAG TPA: kelch repeat-containing protein [Chitinophagaceae bacterium]|nr:kelch repeat-containing protein [Chitinophagaceae bacterium]
MLYSVILLVQLLNYSNEKINEPSSTPVPRWGHVLVYDPVRNTMLLFGGRAVTDNYFDDTWIWDGKEWNKKDLKGPSARGFCAVTFHEGRKSIILHGGRGNNSVTYSDTWEWDGEKWSLLQADSDYKADHHHMVYIAPEQRILAFGGWDGTKVTGETWSWTNMSWKKLNVASPPKRAAYGMAYDRTLNRVKLYGGLWVDGQYADIWEWYNGSWNLKGGSYDNSSLDHHSLFYDEKLRYVLGFGGKNYRYKAQNNTFRIHEGSLLTVTSNGPSARYSFGIAYDSKMESAYLFGGKELKGEIQIALNDFWKWDGKTWTKIQ